MNIRPLTREDLVALWQTEDIGHSVRGFAAEQDGQVLGLTGLMYMPTVIIAFADMQVEGSRYAMTIMRITRLMVDLMRQIKAPIFCNADPDLPNSMAFLERVGFQHVAGRQYRWSNP